MELTVNRSNISSTVIAAVNRIGDIYEYLDNLPLWMGSEFRSRMRAVQLALEAVPTLHMTRFQSEIFERTKQLLRISADGEDFLKAGCADLHTDKGMVRLDWSVADLCEEQIGEWKSTFRTVMLGWRYDVLCLTSCYQLIDLNIQEPVDFHDCFLVPSTMVDTDQRTGFPYSTRHRNFHFLHRFT